jgi:MFS family permease
MSTSPISQVLALLAGVVLMMAGAGTLTSALSIRMEQADVAASTIGLVMAAYFAGTTVGSLFAYRVVVRVGHIRAFATFMSVLSAATLGHALAGDVVAWGVLRGIEGYCMAGLLICVESWLNQKASPTNRGKLLAIYMVCLYGGYGAGQFLLGWPAVAGTAMFAALSILLSVALVPVALTRQTPPELPDVKAFGLTRLFSISPLGATGALVSGAVTGALYSLGPIYAMRLGFGAVEAGQFMSAAIIGGVLLQWPLGWLSDLFDRRTVLVGLFAALAAVSLTLALLPSVSFPWVLAGAVAVGGLTFVVYPVCLAQTNDHLAPSDMVAASGGMILLYSIGATIGPFASSMAVEWLGAPGMMASSAILAAATAAFGVWRMRVKPPVPAQDQGQFTAMPRTTPMAVALAPSGDEG